MPTPASQADLDLAIDIIKQAGRYTLDFFRSEELEILHKSDGSRVTQADRGAEHLIRDLIHAAHPEDAVLGEEHGSVDGTTGRRWVIDPIDGTHAFTHGVGLYSNLLYLEDDEGPAIGVIYVPVLDEIVAAGRGLGCFFNGEPCRVSDHATFEAEVLTTSGFDYWDEDMLVRARNSELKLRTWGDGYGYLLVATGRAHAMVDPVINFWDIAPCQVIIPEAGGRITMLDGTDDPHGESCIATNGVLHDAIVETLNGRRADA